jgi:hypothetical protein
MKTAKVLTSLLSLLSIQSAASALTIALSGENQVPAIASTVTGTATIDLLSDGTIDYAVTLVNPDGVELLGAAGAHIHCGAMGGNGPAVAFLAQPVDGGLLTSPLEVTGVLDDSSIVDGACGSTIALLYASIRAGGAYINVHSTENPSGEVRGQLPEPIPVDDAINVSLSGENQVPAITSTVTGTATIHLLSDGTLDYTVTLVNPDGVELLGAAGAHIHCGASGENGPAVAFLAQPVDGGLLTSFSEVSGFLDDSSIVDDTCGATITMLYASIKAGAAYINVHSTENPSGEVRGQIMGTALSVSLSGENEVPAITSTVTGTATMNLLSDNTIEYLVNIMNPDGVALLGAAGAHIHCGAMGENGAAVAFLAQPVDGGLLTSSVQLSGVLDDSGIVDDTCGATIALLYASIRAGGAYINVHSTENPSGEVRGQVPEPTPVDDAINVSLSGESEVPAITSTVTGTATINLLSDSTIGYAVTLVNPDGVELLGAAGAHIHCGARGENGPAVAFLAQPVDGGLLTSPLEVSGVLDDSSIVDDTCGATITMLYASIKAGEAYINVHSTENPSGEVRGQIPNPIPVSDVINVSLSGESQVPAITSSVTGTATIGLLSDGSIGYSVFLVNPDGVELLGAAGAHIHCGASDANGSVVAFLAQPVEGGRMEEEVDFNGFLDATSILDEACGATIELLYTSIMEGRAYVNVHSTENPSGEVRGQVLIPVTMAPTSAPDDSASSQFKFRSAFAGVAVALVAVLTM